MTARTCTPKRRAFLPYLAALLTLLAFFVAPATPARAATVTVTIQADTNNTCATDGTTAPCSIRDAVAYANAHAGTTVSIPVNTYNMTQGEFGITADMTITGAAANTTILDASNSSRIFNIGSGATVNVSGLTIRNGTSTDGGGIRSFGTRFRQPHHDH